MCASRDSDLDGDAFTYSDLPVNPFHIRLLHLYPSRDKDAPLRCHLSPVRVDVDPPPIFSALSYTWGCDDRTHVFFVHENLSSISPSVSTFSITASLDDALRHLRHATDTLVLWIDQICINQGHATEKASQVARMKTIYALAVEVLIWLGPAEADSDKAMDAWQSVGQSARDWGLERYYTRERPYKLQSLLHPPNELTDKRMAEDVAAFHRLCLGSAARYLGKKDFDMSEPDDLSIFKALIAWYQRPWFSRVWVMQEYALGNAPIFVCGYKRVDAQLVVLARQILDFEPTLKIFYQTDAHGQPGPPPFSRAALLANLFHDTAMTFALARNRYRRFLTHESPGSSLLDLVNVLYTTEFNQKFRATDPRDRIYGLLGLAVDAQELNIIPDYSDRMDATRVYITTTRAIIQKQKPHIKDDYILDILFSVRFPKIGSLNIVESLPSWTPDFESTTPTFCHRVVSTVNPRPFFSASGPVKKPRILVTTDDRILGLEGFLVDVVEITGDPWMACQRNEYDKYLSYLKDVAKLCELSSELMPETDPIYPSPERRSEAVWRVPVGDMGDTPDRRSRRATLETAHMAERFVGTIRLMLGSDSATDLCSPAGMEEWVARVRAREAEPEHAQERIYITRLDKMAGRRPFVSRIGYVGMAPLNTCQGDVIVVPFGAQVPFVLRPVSDGRQGFFTLLGEAYCDGIMDGEMLQKSKTEAFYLV